MLIGGSLKHLSPRILVKLLQMDTLWSKFGKGKFQRVNTQLDPPVSSNFLFTATGQIRQDYSTYSTMHKAPSEKILNYTSFLTNSILGKVSIDGNLWKASCSITLDGNNLDRALHKSWTYQIYFGRFLLLFCGRAVILKRLSQWVGWALSTAVSQFL